MKKPYSPIEMELRKLGLSENEAATYLASLELGHASVQKLAAKVGLSRPTMYRILKSLHKKDLIETMDGNRGGQVAPKSPDELLGLLRVQKRKIDEQEREFIRIISLLKTQCAPLEGNQIEIYSGSAGKKFVLEDFSTTHAKQVLVLFDPNSGVSRKELEAAYEKIRKRLGKIEVVEMCSEKTKPSSLNYIKRTFSTKIFPGTVILGHKMLYFSNDKILSIKEESVIKIAKFLFQSAC